MEKKKWLFGSLFLLVIVLGVFFVVLKNNEKSPVEKRIDKIKKELVNHSKEEAFSCVNIETKLQNNVVYVFDITSLCGDIKDLKVVIISEDDSDFLLTYGFYQNSDILVLEKANDEDITLIRLLTSSSSYLSDFYVYLSYNDVVEYLKVGIGD